MSEWHLNSDQPLYTRHAEPASWQAGRNLYDILAFDDALLRRTIAVHEAAHAVMHFAFGIPVEEIRIADALGKDTGPGGWVKSTGAWSVPYMRYLTMCAAGERAQDRWMREQGLWTPERAWVCERTATEDRNQAARSARDCGLQLHFGTGPARDGLHYRAVQDTAEAALAPLWDRVMNLAAAADTHGRLSGHAAAGHARLAHTAIVCPEGAS
ncbi:hypothetical protein ACFVTP_11915 [Streptomyces celluloflavus]|uniref:hypothetical protein n=1 Tax=Streptomyces celluloflavus TaxID=58344 RepID=UPI0036D78CF6